MMCLASSSSWRKATEAAGPPPPGGNITGMGGEMYSNDPGPRVWRANLSAGSQFYAYDRYGNLITKAFTDPGSCLASTSWSNNRVPAATYDQGVTNGRGNLTSYGGQSFTWDALDRMTSSTQSPLTWNYLYDGSGERIAKSNPTTGALTYTFRDESNRVVSEFAKAVGSGP